VKLNSIIDNSNYGAWQKAFKEKGYFEWKATIEGKEVSTKVYPRDVEANANWDTSYIKTQFPPNVDVFTLHGLSDKTIPP
jgi:uncharacterized protein